MLLLVLAMADTVSGAARSGSYATPMPPPAAIAAQAPPASAAPSPAPSSAPAAPSDTAAPATAGPAAGVATTAAPATGSGAADPSAAAPEASTAPAPVTPATPDGGTPATASPAQASPAGPAAATETSASAAQTAYITAPFDPWVKINRRIFSFDMTLERGVLAPVAHGYNHVLPRGVRFHVTSALLNLGEPLTAVNDLLQLRIRSMSKAAYRFVINSSIGIAGLFDVAKASGVPIHISDFGQTLGRYGLKPGPYVMLPLLGPSDVRDGFGRLVDTFMDPMQFLIGGIATPEGASLFLFEGVDWRARSEDTMKAIYEATDPYAFTRSAYTQLRASAVLEATGKQAALPDFDAVPGTH